MFAAKELFKDALESVGLTNQGNIERALKKIAKKHDIKITQIDGEVAMEQALNILRDIEIDAELSCLATTLTSIESDLSASLERALAWVDGDASLLKAFEYPDVEARCTNATFNSPDAMRAREQTREQWLTSVERALRENEVTFTSLPIRELIHPQGLLAVLDKRGYRVRGQ